MGLPIFFKETDDKRYLVKRILFPLDSNIAIHLPILVMLVGLMIIGTFTGILCINQQKIIDSKKITQQVRLKQL